MSLRKVLLLCALVGMLIVAVPTGFVAHAVVGRLRAEPIDATHVKDRLGIHIPFRVITLVKRDVVAYQAHAGLALFIETTGGDSGASAVQWLKAAAHTRSSDNLERVIAGLRAARGRASDVQELQAELCGYVERCSASGRQGEALTSAGLRCTSRVRG
jgi:hypothetical protein